ncbi:hypothetical protein PCASD_17649 [Puccinia coronata f. sp. avenae]|uniref:Uncharacterized protein n=1 Tax=Puccinia coronata f. sp. avenae TaxID=200324 RepID=A0A2N5SWI8_9BASI|nr:hypothetical protein PCASD_17649 [Puccinia coronata f. sp. avenae]
MPELCDEAGSQLSPNGPGGENEKPSQLEATVKDANVSQIKKKKKKKGKGIDTLQSTMAPLTLKEQHEQKSPNHIHLDSHLKTEEAQKLFPEGQLHDHTQNERRVEVTEMMFASVRKSENSWKLAIAEDYRIRIKSAFEPREDEIYPNISKSRCGHAVNDHNSEASRFVRKSVQALNNAPRRAAKTRLLHSLAYDKLSETLYTQLKLDNPQNHLPILSLAYETYILLQMIWNLHRETFFEIHDKLFSELGKMSKYELQRRMSALMHQITQKTIVENWNLISNALTQTSRKPMKARIKIIQDRFQLAQEFPTTHDAPYIYTVGTKDSAEESTGGEFMAIRRVLSNFFRMWMGSLEFQRRFRDPLEIGPKPTIQLSAELSERLREAEVLNGADTWNVYHWINCLGLGQVKQLNDLRRPDIVSSVDVISRLMELPTYKQLIPWHESADRACIIQMFTEETYLDHLHYICRTFKEIRKGHSEGDDWKRKATVSQILRFQAEDKLKMLDVGLDVKLMESIKITMDYNPELRQDWQLFFDTFPSKFKPAQRSFITSWFTENKPV